jgi:hypothetical protein
MNETETTETETTEITEGDVGTLSETLPSNPEMEPTIEPEELLILRQSRKSP